MVDYSSDDFHQTPKTHLIREEDLEEILKQLYSLKRKPNKVSGICSNLSFKNRSQWKWLNNTFSIWPKFSGNIFSPIAIGGESTAAKEFIVAYRDNSFWDRNTEYGRLRWELLDFLIETAEKELLSLQF